MSRPNILLIVFDTARRDVVEPFGAPAGATPAIAQLAQRGAALSAGYANCSWTLPSHASMFTGLLPRRIGLTQAPDGVGGVRPIMESLSERLLPAVLAGHGYRTQGWVTNHWVSRFAGFDIGFDRFEFVDSGRTQRMEALLGQGRRAQLAWAREGLRSHDDDGAAAVGRQLRGAIETWSGEPTFWFVNLTECHSPYLPPRPWNDLPPWERARAALDVRRHLTFLAICLHVCGRAEGSPEAFERMRHLYARAVSYMDQWLSDVLEALDRKGILDNTLVIVTSDHGENFGEDGLIAHGFSLDQRLINIPLVMAGPGTPSDADRVFSLAEIPQLIAAVAGIEDVPWRPEELPAGVAVAQYDPLAALDNPKMRHFAAEYGLSDSDLEPLCADFTAVTDGRFKLVIRNDRESLFDIGVDPQEQDPLSGDEAAEHRAALRHALSHPGLERGGEPAQVSAAGTPAASAEEVEAIERQMKLLGYL